MNNKASLIYNVISDDEKAVTIAINGFIGDPEEGNNPMNIGNILNANKGKEVIVQIHSPGGFAADGIHIHDLLSMYDGKITTEIHGWSASAATIISQAGHRKMSANASMLIHRAWGLAIGNVNDMLSSAATLERMDDSIIAIYKKAGANEEVINNLMAENGGHGKFISAQEALDAGLIDEIFEPTEYNAYKKADIQALAKNLGLPEVPEQAVTKLTAEVHKDSTQVDAEAQISERRRKHINIKNKQEI